MGFGLGFGVVAVAVVAATVELVVEEPLPQPASAMATTTVIGRARFIKRLLGVASFLGPQARVAAVAASMLAR